MLSLPTSTATPFQAGSNASAPPPSATIFIGSGNNPHFPARRITIFDWEPFIVLHPAGNIAEHLVATGLARVVDWHAGMLANNGGMERLRAAEKAAKEKRAYLYANAPAPTTKSNGAAVNGGPRTFDAIVTRVWSGDQISVVDKDGSKERRLQFSSTRGPK